MIDIMTMRSTSTRHSTLDSRIGDLAAGQCGALSRAQALAAGATDSLIQRRVHTGRWERPRPGVYVIAGCPPSWMQEVWCAFLAAGTAAVVTHETALLVHAMPLVPRYPVTLTVPHGSHARLPGVVVHQIDDLSPGRFRHVEGLPVSTAERVIVELAATQGSRQLARIVDEAVRHNRTGYHRIGACLQEVARRGKPGVRKLAAVLDERGPGFVPPQSELEAALFSALTAGRLPEPRRQFPLPSRGGMVGLVDAGYPEARLLIEADGQRWHTRIADLRRDHDRDAEAARVGCQTLRFLHEQIVHEPSEVCATIRDVLAVRAPQSLLAA